MLIELARQVGRPREDAYDKKKGRMKERSPEGLMEDWILVEIRPGHSVWVKQTFLESKGLYKSPPPNDIVNVDR